MLNLLKRLFRKDKKLPTEKTTETKKCMRCLRRVAVYVPKCPQCGGQDFEW